MLYSYIGDLCTGGQPTQLQPGVSTSIPKIIHDYMAGCLVKTMYSDTRVKTWRHAPIKVLVAGRCAVALFDAGAIITLIQVSIPCELELPIHPAPHMRAS